MAYRKITVGDRDYKWKVGRANIEIRHDDDGKPFKLVLPRPNSQCRWGVIYPNWLVDVPLAYPELSIEIFFNYEKAVEKFKAKKKCKAGADKVELTDLRDKQVSIKPEWIKQQIISRLTVDWKARK